MYSPSSPFAAQRFRPGRSLREAQTRHFGRGDQDREPAVFPEPTSALNPKRKGVSDMRKIVGMLVLGVALLLPAQGVMAAEHMMKKMQETDSKMDKVMKMMKEKKMKMTPEQEKKLMQMLDEINKLLDDITTKHG
jgi:hypothetical protein